MRESMKIYLEHLGEVLLTALIWAALRALALFFAVRCLSGGWGILWIVPGMLVCLFAALPQRVFSLMRLRRFAGGSVQGKLSYPVCLRAGLSRFLRGLVWCIPAAVFLGIWIYGFWVMYLPSFYPILKQIGAFFGGRVDTGTGVLLGCLLLTSAFAAVGWWLDLETDFRDATIPDSRAERQQRRLARNRSFGKRIVSCMINILLTLPSAALWLTVLVRRYFGDIHFHYGLMTAATELNDVIRDIFRSGLSPTVLLRMVLILLLVHLPLAAFRKTRNAVLIMSVTEGKNGNEA